MRRFGIVGEGRLGASIPSLRHLARSIGTDHPLALRLWRTGIPDAMILAAFIGDPLKISSREMDRWVGDLMAWDVCDQLCSNLFDRSPFAWRKVGEWAAREEEFVKRAGFVLIAALALHDREAPDGSFLAFLPLIRREATDERNYVRKGVNWALRHIGKRNLRLHRAAVAEARRIQMLDSRSARWIAADALRELRHPKTITRLKTRQSPRRSPS
jgi:3-methyladenine DNA glycosylase AlkD